MLYIVLINIKFIYYDAAVPGSYTRKYYVNNSTTTASASGAGTGAKNIANTGNALGSSAANTSPLQYSQLMYSGQFGFFYWASVALSDADRIALQNTTAFY